MDAWVNGDEDWDFYGDGGYYGPQPKTCRRCKASGLHWSFLGGKRRLHDTAGNKHVCTNADPKKVFK